MGRNFNNKQDRCPLTGWRTKHLCRLDSWRISNTSYNTQTFHFLRQDTQMSFLHKVSIQSKIACLFLLLTPIYSSLLLDPKLIEDWNPKKHKFFLNEFVLKQYQLIQKVIKVEEKGIQFVIDMGFIYFTTGVLSWLQMVAIGENYQNVLLREHEIQS